jgi:hypothetical protein
MSKILLAAGVAAMVLTAGSSLAAGSRHKSDKSAHATVAGPPQPIPYAQLDAYLKASPKQRASRDWSGGATTASTGATADTSATARTSPSAAASPDTSASPPAAQTAPDTSSAPAAATPDQGKGDPSAAPPATKTPPDAASPN